MELKYIWVKEYNNIKEAGFNFKHSGNKEFLYTNGELIIIDSLTNTQNFFGENITGVTAIVGKNGAGKTNLGEFINYNLAHATNGMFSTYYDSGAGIIIIDNFIFKQEKLIIKNEQSLRELGYIINEYEIAPLDHEGNGSWSLMAKNRYIYYSPTFEFRYIDMRDNLTNISTSYLAFNDLYYTDKHYYSKRHVNSYQYNPTDSLIAHYRNEMIRQSDFILNNDVEALIGESPIKMKISVDMVKENRLLQRPFFPDSDEKQQYKEDLWTKLSEIESDIWRSGFSHLSNFVVNQDEHNSTHNYYSIPIKEKKSMFRQIFFLNLFKILLNNNKSFPKSFFDDFLNKRRQKTDIESIRKLRKIDNKLTILLNNCEWDDSEQKVYIDTSNWDDNERNIFDLIRNLYINIDSKAKSNIFNDLLTLCKEVTEDASFFHYQFLHVYSSGQQTFLNFYSRFYYAKNQLNKVENYENESFRDQIIVFFDEGEVALHPEWQRRFFKRAISFISELFNDRKIQIILTTHSPFVLSDIPKQNIIFLERDENGNTKLADVDREDTFGANIYTLLSDSFFMENTIGEFAREKIKWALEKLDPKIQSEISDSEKAEINYIISLIGEPIIKDQMEYLFRMRFENDEVELLKQQVKELQDQLKNQAQ